MTYDYNGEIPATLGEMLEKLDDKTVIGVGSASGFIFIGTKSEYYRDADLWLKFYNMRSENNLNKHMTRTRKPFVERKIKEMYWQKDTTDSREPLKLCIIIEGRESGLIWFAHEYEAIAAAKIRR